jgi:hypothetical protein
MDKKKREPERVEAPEPAKNLIFKGFGLECPIPRWVLAPIGLVLVLALVGYLVQQFVLPIAGRLKELDALEAEKNEAYKHSAETATLLAASDPSLRVNYFKSDGCLQVVRGGRQAQWLLAPPAQPQPAPGRVTEIPALGALPWEGTAEAQAPGGAPPPPGCLNPHPGAFKQWDGERKGCWQQEFRQFADGCRHYQWYDACHRTWDVQADGRPRVYWTTCNRH